MEHSIQFGVNIDDDAIRREVAARLRKVEE